MASTNQVTMGKSLPKDYDPACNSSAALMLCCRNQTLAIFYHLYITILTSTSNAKTGSVLQLHCQAPSAGPRLGGPPGGDAEHSTLAVAPHVRHLFTEHNKTT